MSFQRYIIFAGQMPQPAVSKHWSRLVNDPDNSLTWPTISYHYLTLPYNIACK